MAIIHQEATITPTKREVAAAWLDRQGLGTGDVEMLGSYRFDDPEGEVGIEALLVRRAGEVFHLPVTYRDAPLDGAGARLITTMRHSVLGSRWVYEAQGTRSRSPATPPRSPGGRNRRALRSGRVAPLSASARTRSR